MMGSSGDNWRSLRSSNSMPSLPTPGSPLRAPPSPLTTSAAASMSAMQAPGTPGGGSNYTPNNKGRARLEYHRRFEEAYNFLARQRHLLKLDALFRKTDVDRSGSITLEEFQEALKKPSTQSQFASLGIQPHQASVVFKAFDLNCDGMLSHQEFVEGLMRISDPDFEGCGVDLDLEDLKAQNWQKQQGEEKPINLTVSSAGTAVSHMGRTDSGGAAATSPAVRMLGQQRLQRAFIHSARAQALHPAGAQSRSNATFRRNSAVQLIF